MQSPSPGSTLLEHVCHILLERCGGGRPVLAGCRQHCRGRLNLGRRPRPLLPRWWADLPCDGRTLHVQLYTHINGAWLSPQRYTYTAPTGCSSTSAQIASPTPGTVLTGTTITFAWGAVSGADQYWLDVGNSVATGDIWAGALTATSKVVSGLPCDARTIYVQLYTHMNGAWLTAQRYTYTAPSGCTIAQIASPTPGTVLTGTTITFAWGAVGRGSILARCGQQRRCRRHLGRRPHCNFQGGERPPLRRADHLRTVVYPPQQRLANSSALYVHCTQRMRPSPDHVGYKNCPEQAAPRLYPTGYRRESRG